MKGDPPVEYLDFVYRRAMHYTPKEVEEISPFTVINDLKMMTIEAEWQRNQGNPQKK